MYILGLHNGSHDASACLFDDYRLVAAVSLERLTRKKNDGVTIECEIPLAAIDECLAIAGISRADVDVVCATRSFWEMQSYTLRGRWRIKQAYYGLKGDKRLYQTTYMMRKQSTRDAQRVFDLESFRRRYGFEKTRIFFANHHAAHGISAYFFSEFEDALIYTADGFGDDVSYSARAAVRGDIKDLLGGDENLHLTMKPNSVGMLYSFFTQALGFILNRHEGKVTGLAGFGTPKAAKEIRSHFAVDERGEISSDFADYVAMDEYAREMCQRLSREDAAASVQQATEWLVCEAIEKLLPVANSRSLALSGGVFANVRLNRTVLESTCAERLFVFPAMGDEGLPVGACLLYLWDRDGPSAWYKQRYPLRELYLGRDHDGEFDAAAKKCAGVQRLADEPVKAALDALIKGDVVAIYTGRMEYGPRALGARSILASPTRRDVNDTINKRLDRSEFMPFAPVVLAEHASQVFDLHAGNAHAAQFMTITCDVHPDWQERIPAVVHVDGSARPQVVSRDINPLYFDVLDQFYQRTGLPVLVNTSFNVHEEPIVNTPDQALKSLYDGRIDAILTKEALYTGPKG